MSTIDFRSNQIQTSKIIVTGSSPEKTLLIYGIAADDTSSANQGNIDPTVFDTSVIGSDVFLFVSGGIGARGGSIPWISAFGGDLHISGNLSVDGTVPGGPSFFTEIALDSIATTGSVAMTFLSASAGAEITGSVTQGSINNVASGTNSHAEGNITTASGDNSHSEGVGATASGTNSHAEGNSTTASGDNSHSEGVGTTASGYSSHAEGVGTTAYGEISHAEGVGSEAYGTGSFAAGLYTVASGAVDGISPQTTIQAAFGKYNLRDNVDSLFVIGDGLDDSNRHDVLRVNSGSVQVTGSLFVNGFQITSSIQKLNIAGYNRTNYTSPEVVGLAYFNPTEYSNYSNIAFTAVGMNMAGVSGGLDLYNQNTSTLVAQLTWSGTSTLTTGSFQTIAFSFPVTATSYELHFSQSGGANGGTDYSTVGFVNFVLS